MTTSHHRQEPDTGHANRLVVREWRPASPRGVFLLLHGMESHSIWWGEFASRLVAAGWAAIAYDRSGWGQSQGIRGHMASYRDFVEEASGLAVSAREKYGTVHLAGMSWGGMAALYLCLRRGWLFDSLTVLAPGLVSRQDLSWVGKLKAAAGVLRHNPTRMIEPVFHPEHFTTDPGWQTFIKDDPDRVRQVSASFCFETTKMRRFCRESAGRRRLPPSLCLLAGDDVIVDNVKTGSLCRQAGMEVEEASGAAHTLVFERPGETAERLVRHAEASAERRNRVKGGVWIVGGGAVGGGVGTLLSLGGVRTGMLVKEKYLPELRRSGFSLRAGRAVRSTGPSLLCASDPADLPPDPALVILAVKSYDTEATVASLIGRIPDRTVLCSLQNGVRNEGHIAAAFPNHTVVAGSICASLETTGPGAIAWPDDRGGVAGAVFQGDPALAKRVWLDTLPATGMDALWMDGARAAARLKWSKLMLNIGFNALNSLTGMSSAELLRDQRYGRLAVLALREGFAVMRAQKLEPFDLPGYSVNKLSLAVRAPVDLARKMMAFEAGRSSEASFSMRQDMLKKSQHTEIQDLNGTIVETADYLGLRADANRELLLEVEKAVKDSQCII